MSRAVKACFFGRCSACQPPFPAECGLQFAGTFRAVVPVDFCLELVKGDKHRTALVLSLLGLAAEPFGEPPKGNEGRDEDERRQAHAAPDSGADAAAILPKLVSLLGTGNDDAKAVLTALGWRLTEVKDASPVWRRRKEKPRKAAPVQSRTSQHSPFAGLKELMVK